MDIAKLGGHPLPVGPDIENPAITSPGTPREAGALESTEHASGHESPATNLPKRPLDEPALKAVLSEKLNVRGQSAGSTVPSTRMEDSHVDFKGWGEEDGTDAGPEAPSGDGWDVSKNGDPKSLNSSDDHLPKSGDDNNGPTRGVGFTFTGRPGREGDGHTTAASGGAVNSSGSTPSNSSSTSSSSPSSGSTGTSSSTGTRHKK
ncbi:MAG TPA: hypothetical protein VK466_12550 [Terriglobales bacterium]|nr:hypothetical protein [Terriglobales bacterium]